MKHLQTFIVSLAMLTLVMLMTCGPVAAEEPDTDEVVFTSAYLAENPELMVAIRYMDNLDREPYTRNNRTSQESERLTNSVFYATNPELIFAHRYMAALEKKNSLFASH